MKLVISLFILSFSLSTLAAEITCNPDKRTSKFAVKAEQGESIEVAALERGGTGYIWHSVEKLQFKLEVGDGLGSGNTRIFSIDSDMQVGKSKRYTFRLSRAWTPEGKALAICTVVVKK